MLLSCSQLFPSKLTFTKMDTPPAPKSLLPVPSAPVAHLDTYSLMHSHEFHCYSHRCFSIMVSYHVLFGLIHIPSWTGATSAVSGPAVPPACGFAVEAAAGVASCMSTHITAIHGVTSKSDSFFTWDFECHDLISCNGCMNLHKHALNQALKATCRLSNPSNSSIWCLCMSLYVAKSY